MKDFLSPEGKDRRSRILQLAISEAQRRRQRRWIAPVSGVAVAGILVAVIVLRANRQEINHPVAQLPVVVFHSQSVVPGPATEPTIVVQTITTDPTIAERLSIKPEPAQWTMVDDQELLKELAEAGQPAGLAYVDGKSVLLQR